MKNFANTPESAPNEPTVLKEMLEKQKRQI
jgi:hypothetical protein